MHDIRQYGEEHLEKMIEKMKADAKNAGVDLQFKTISELAKDP